MNAKTRTPLKLALAALAMFGFGFALVPIYDKLCEVTGLGGRTNSEAIAADTVRGEVDQTRTVTVEFVSSVNAGAPWEFKPAVAKMQVTPGKFYHTEFYAENLSEQALSGQGVPSVAPAESSRFLQKIECFCFNRQEFQPFEGKKMPVTFRVDPKLPARFETITLSYTFYRLDTSS